jgi:hypothetical protein
LVGKPERKEPFGRPRRKWVDTIKINLKEKEWEDIVWIELAQDSEKKVACSGEHVIKVNT